MYYSIGLEYIVENPYSISSSSHVSYFSKIVADNYSLGIEPISDALYIGKRSSSAKYKNQEYLSIYSFEHPFTPQILLNSSRPKTRFIDNGEEIGAIVEETFELMMNEKLPESISISILPFDEFKALHSRFGSWSNGILGFSINGQEKKVFVRENNLDELMIVIGHEIGHVLTESLPNKHDEEGD